MKDILKDVVHSTNGLGFTNIRVEPNKNMTHFRAMSPEKTIEFNGYSKKPVKEFKSVFGMTNLNVLKGYLDIYDNYKNSDIKVNVRERNDMEIPFEFEFSGEGLSKAKYRLAMEPNLNMRKKLPEWTLTLDKIEKKRIDDFQRFSSVLSSDEDNKDKRFSISTIDGNLIFHVGNENGSSNYVELIMAENVDIKLKRGLTFPITEILNIFKKHPNSSFSIHEKGFCEIRTDTGLMDAEFFFLGANS